jgi:hypothetical protein
VLEARARRGAVAEVETDAEARARARTATRPGGGCSRGGCRRGSDTWCAISARERRERVGDRGHRRIEPHLPRAIRYQSLSGGGTSRSG